MPAPATQPAAQSGTQPAAVQPAARQPAARQPAARQPANLDAALRALADGNRRAILALVREHPLAVGDIAARVDVTQQGVSHHLGVLKRAGLVAETRDGTRHLFAVRTDGLAAVRTYLDDFWPTQLAALKKAVEDAANG